MFSFLAKDNEFAEPIHLSDQQENILEKNLVWILASPRSGTTWLATELLSPKTICFHEPLIGEHLAWAKQSGSDHVRRIDIEKNRPHYFFSEKFENTWKYYLRKLILHRIHSQFPMLHKKIIVKEPNGSLGADIISKCLPNSKIIFMFRDGRDVLLSQLTALSKGGYAAEMDKNFEPLSGKRRVSFIKDQSLRWNELVEILLRTQKQHPKNLQLLLHYEDIIKNTFEELKKIYEFIGVKISDDEIKDVIAKYDFKNISSDKKGLGTTRQFATAGQWQGGFNIIEKKLIDGIMKDSLKKLGYTE